MNKKFVKGKKASEILGVHRRTLYQWDKKGKIETMRTPGGMRLYNVDKYLKDNCKMEDCSENVDELDNIDGKINLSYCRVSSTGQKEDLIRQQTMIKKYYPDHIMITDIGSGIKKSN